MTMGISQNDLERLTDRLDRGELSADQANVEKVRIARVQLLTSKMPQQVRRALNSAVKTGELGHMKKDGHKPECWFHPTFKHLANEARTKHENHVRRCCGSSVFASSEPIVAEMLTNN